MGTRLAVFVTIFLLKILNIEQYLFIVVWFHVINIA